MAQRKKATKQKAATKKAVAATTTPDSCFVIMPFGGWFDDYYASIFCPAIEAAGLKPCRADDLYRPSTIVHDIWEYAREARLVLADLTGRNPNVFYELGLVHALAKPAILVAETIEDVPFDLRALRVIEYNKNAPNWGDVLRTKIEASIAEVLKAPLESVLPAFINVRPSSQPTVTPHQKEILELKQDIELLKQQSRLGRSEEGLEQGFGPRQARMLIAELIRIGASNKTIVSLVAKRGAPRSFVEREVREMRAARGDSVKGTGGADPGTAG
jgi:hypothetical protein